MSPLVKMLVEQKVKKIDDLIAKAGEALVLGRPGDAKKFLIELKLEVADVKARLLS